MPAGLSALEAEDVGAGARGQTAGLPIQWEIPQAEMYGDPFHIPAPDEEVFEEKCDKREFLRCGCVWKVGKGRVFYLRPCHET